MASAEDQMRFQLYTSNTSHQREVEDLKKAGLNPVLSAGSLSGAQAMSGASDSSSSGGSGGSGSAAGDGKDRDGLLGDIIDNLNPNGSFKIGKVSIPNSVIITLYDYGVENWDAMTAQVNKMFGTDVTAVNLNNLISNSMNDSSAPDNQTGVYNHRLMYDPSMMNTENSAKQSYQAQIATGKQRVGTYLKNQWKNGKPMKQQYNEVYDNISQWWRRRRQHAKDTAPSYSEYLEGV